MQGHAVKGLTVVISPLQSLMKDQVDNLSAKGITDAVTINGLLDPISRSLAIEQVVGGEASLLYIAPEMLRSRTIERILLSRNVVRFVIDEAHIVVDWGTSFRVDYQCLEAWRNQLLNTNPTLRTVLLSATYERCSAYYVRRLQRGLQLRYKRRYNGKSQR